MRLFSELKRAAQILSRYPSQWAICGGVAASLYRESARFTDDIDFAVVDSEALTALDLARKVIGELGYKEYKGFIPDENNQQIFGLLCARDSADDRFVGLDFLLPAQCWVSDAVNYAQANIIDYGFDKLPTITPESLIVSKIIALNSNPERLQDIDDINEIVRVARLDMKFIQNQLQSYRIKIPPAVAKLFI